MGALIEFKDVSKSFGDRKILNKVNLEIDKGDILGLIGPSGSGKTTLMNILLGALRPDAGKVFFKEMDVTKDPMFLRKHTGLTTQENSFYEKLSVYENMVYYSNLYKVKKTSKELDSHIMDILKSVDLAKAKDTLAGKISGGMKRRLDFAISMLHEPELLILDEPTTGLDPILVEQFWKIIESVAEKGKTILVISHIFPELKEHCNRACILNSGKVTLFNISKSTDLMKEFRKVL